MIIQILVILNSYLHQNQGVDSMNVVLETIMHRRSIRKYKPDLIDREILSSILNSASFAPYSISMQSMNVTAFQGKKHTDKINRCIRECLLALPKSESTHPYVKSLIEKAEDKNSDFIYNAPAVVMLSSSKANPTSGADCAAAMENILLTASSFGIGSCWLNQLPGLTDMALVRELMDSYGIPDDHIIFAAAALGHAADDLELTPKETRANIKIYD